MEDFLSVLKTCKICRIGTADDAGMMLVPMNFGYEVSGEDVMLYFHTGLEGRKLRALRKDPRVCFEVDDKGELVCLGDRENPCKYSYVIHSAMGTGLMEFVEAPEEEKLALEKIVLHQTGRSLSVPM